MPTNPPKECKILLRLSEQSRLLVPSPLIFPLRYHTSVKKDKYKFILLYGLISFGKRLLTKVNTIIFVTIYLIYLYLIYFHWSFFEILR